MSAGKKNTAILLTPRTMAAIAVIRLQGSGIREFLKYFSRPVLPGRAVHGELRDGDKILDDPVIVAGTNFSFIDINVHGGMWVIDSVLDLARRNGFEFVENSFQPNTFAEADSILQREMLASLPLAKTELGIAALLAQPDAWRKFESSPEGIQKILNDRALWWLLHPPRVAIVGEANVGKSTLANRLFAQERSITADMPGTTRDWVGEIADLHGLAILLVDTPGLRTSEDQIEQAAIAASRVQIQQADLVIHVLDATRAPQVKMSWPDSIVVMNKSDQTPGWKPDQPFLPLSAKTDEGVANLESAIHARFGLPIQIDQPRWWTERQRGILQRVISDPNAISEMLVR